MNINMKDLALEFYTAHKEKKNVELLSNRGILIDEKSAYKIQEMVTNLKIQDNHEEILGYKISMTSEEMRKLGKSIEPAYGTFTSSSLANGTIQMNSNYQYLLEPELIFVLTEDLSLGASSDEIIQKSKLAAGLEIPMGRYANWFPPSKGHTVGDTIADNTFAGFILPGEAIDIPDSIDWKNIKSTLYFNDEILDEGYSSDVMGNPVNAVCWLSGKLAQKGKYLKRGMIVSSGTFTNPKILKKGVYRVVYDLVGELTLNVE
ncbi:2-keto-4-pentenoate hydratase [Neobacillus sp. SAB-20_R2A]|uniref:2-keto-4-pentenoate hydratase n=1 Tax=Neobacillus sp. SAB-20_R2A TaxID=3120519 RepID=UPI003C6DBED5